MSMNVSTSIVDYLKSIGQDSSFDNRKKLASQYGITNYTGSAGQNTALLKALQGAANKTQTAAKNQTAKTTAATSGSTGNKSMTVVAEDEPKAAKVDRSMTVEAEDEPVSTALSNAINLANSFGQSTSTNSINLADLYAQALSSVGAAPTYTSSGQADAILAQINARQPFSYDPSTDVTYQQYKDLYTANGNKAMRDTMGNAAALTGGYGNSYATTAGSQAYDAYMQQLNDKSLELRQNALNEYNNETQDLYNRYNAAVSAEDQAYQRYLDQYNMWNSDRQLALSQAEGIANQANADRSFNYGVYRDQVGDDQWQQTFDADETYRNADLDLDKLKLEWQMETDKRDFDYQKEQDDIANQLAAYKAYNSGSSSGSGSSSSSSRPSFSDMQKYFESLVDSMNYTDDQIANFMVAQYEDLVNENSDSYDPQVDGWLWMLLSDLNTGSQADDTATTNNAPASIEEIKAAAEAAGLPPGAPINWIKYQLGLLS